MAILVVCYDSATGGFRTQQIGSAQILDFGITSGKLASGAYVLDSLFNAYHVVTKEPTGFPNLTDTSTPTFSSPTVTLAKTGASFDFYIQGVKYTKSANQTVDLPNGDATDTGTWYIYFNAAGTLTATKTTSWDIAAATECPVAVLYFNGAAGRICDERHGTVMDAATHNLLHYTVGCRYESGLTGTFADPANISVALGIIHDEDLGYDIGIQTQCVPFYHTSGVYTFANAQNSYVVQVADILQYDNLTDLADVPNNKYVAYWVFATLDTTKPIWVMPGQRTDTLLKDARDLNKYESLVLGTLPFPEMKLLYRVILQRSGVNEVYVETQDLRTVSNLPSGTYVATDHGALTGLLDDDHSQYLLKQMVENDPLLLDAAISGDGYYSGICEAGIAGATLVFGNLCYLAVADSRWELTDASAEATAFGKIGICVLAAANNGDPTTILLYGKVRADVVFPNLTIGAPVFMGETAGDVVVAAPVTSGAIVRILGYGNTADELFFCPDNTYVEVA